MVVFPNCSLYFSVRIFPHGITSTCQRLVCREFSLPARLLKVRSLIRRILRFKNSNNSMMHKRRPRHTTHFSKAFFHAGVFAIRFQPSQKSGHEWCRVLQDRRRSSTAKDKDLHSYQKDARLRSVTSKVTIATFLLVSETVNQIRLHFLSFSFHRIFASLEQVDLSVEISGREYEQGGALLHTRPFFELLR